MNEPKLMECANTFDNKVITDIWNTKPTIKTIGLLTASK
jgi:hypothetical protein